MVSLNGKQLAQRSIIPSTIYHLLSTILIINNLSKAVGLQTRAADQCAIDIFLRHQSRNVIGLH